MRCQICYRPRQLITDARIACQGELWRGVKFISSGRRDWDTCELAAQIFIESLFHPHDFLFEYLYLPVTVDLPLKNSDRCTLS